MPFAIITRFNSKTILFLHLFLPCQVNEKLSAEFDASIGIFGLKTPLHEHVIGEHTSMKN